MGGWIRRIGLAGALALALAACSGSGDDDSSASTAVASTTATTSPTTVAPQTTTPATSAPTVTSAAPPASTAPTTAGGSGSLPPEFTADPAFCAAAAEFDERRDIVQSSFSGDSTPDLARQAWDELDGVIVVLVDTSPDLIEQDVETVRRAFAGLRGVFEEYGYDTQKLFDAAQDDPVLAATLQLTEDPEFQAASERIDAFVARACSTP